MQQGVWENRGIPVWGRLGLFITVERELTDSYYVDGVRLMEVLEGINIISGYLLLEQ